MSTVTKSQPPPPVPNNDADDRSPCGCRDVIVRNPDGTKAFEHVALTLDDALHPEFGDYFFHSDAHDDDLYDLRSVFKSLLANDPGALVLSECEVDFELPDVKHVRPDIAVFFEVDIENKRRTEMFHVKAAHARTALVIEVTSTCTRTNDVDTKVGYYHRCGVPMYVIADAHVEDQGARKLELIAYRHSPAGYETISPNSSGWIWLDAIGVWLGVAHDKETGFDRLACFDAVSKNEIGGSSAVSQA